MLQKSYEKSSQNSGVCTVYIYVYMYKVKLDISA